MQSGVLQCDTMRYKAMQYDGSSRKKLTAKRLNPGSVQQKSSLIALQHFAAAAIERACSLAGGECSVFGSPRR